MTDGRECGMRFRKLLKVKCTGIEDSFEDLLRGNFSLYVSTKLNNTFSFDLHYFITTFSGYLT